jgi:hypothetical protein
MVSANFLVDRGDSDVGKQLDDRGDLLLLGGGDGRITMIAEMVIFSSLVAVMDGGDLNAILNQNINDLKSIFNFEKD